VTWRRAWNPVNDPVPLENLHVPEPVWFSVQWPLAVAPFGVTRTTLLLGTLVNTGPLYLATVPSGIDPLVEVRTVQVSAVVFQATARTLGADRIDIWTPPRARVVLAWRERMTRTEAYSSGLKTSQGEGRRRAPRPSTPDP
jgi:hypothetical protein